MPTNVKVKDLKINTLTEAQYNTAVQSGVIGENEISILTDVDVSIQVTTMPTASSENENEIVQYVGATDANYTNGYFYKVNRTGPSSPVFYYNNNDIEITDPTAFINTVNANTDQGLQVVDGSLMYIDAYLDSHNDWEFAISLENPDGSGGYTDTEYCGFTTASLASVGITKNPSSERNFHTCVAYTTSTEPQIYSSWPGGFLIVDPQQFLSFASNILGSASPIGDEISVWLGGSSGSETYNFVYVIGNPYEGTIYQEDYTFTESEFESNLGLRILDPYAEVSFCPITEGTTPTYAWVRVDVQPAPVIPDPLPSQTGNAGKFLTTDGTDVSWSNKPLVNNTAIANSIAIGSGSAGYYGGAVAIGRNAKASGNGTVSVGNSASSSTNSAIMIGDTATGQGVSIGCYAKSNGVGAIAIGTSSFGILSKCEATARCAIQLGTRTINGTHAINADANTFKVANENGNFEIMSADGTVPTARLTKVNTTITLAAANWSSNTQTVNVTGMTATGIVFVNPDPADQSVYTNAGILCTAQAAGTLTFTCDTTPSSDIDVIIIML